MTGAAEELLNVYDALGRVAGAMPRREAKRSGLAVGAVNALVLNGRGELLMQRRPAGRENGALWDKSVGGHVSAGESFDATLAREAGEELFDDPNSRQVRLIADGAGAAEPDFDLARGVLFRPVERSLNLRDVRHAPGGGVRRVVYHLAIYAGRTELPLDGFRPQPDEIDELRYVGVDEVDAMLLAGRLAPNMAFLWLTQAQALLRR
jgi:8-oxo-dGTP pyrophosphatase MutT (NUDIX family)